MKQRSVLLFSLMVLVSSCAGVKAYEPISGEQRAVFLPSIRRNAPELVYARTRWVRPPDVLPLREKTNAETEDRLRESPMLRSVFHLSVKNRTLEETARVLAATARYSSFTAPSIASNKISIENLGTIDELGRIIESKAQITVLVDHENKIVRFMPTQTSQPKLYDE